MTRRTAELKRATADENGTVDEISIGGWFYLELMSDRGEFVYSLIIGNGDEAKRLSIVAPKNASKKVEVIDVG